MTLSYILSEKHIKSIEVDLDDNILFILPLIMECEILTNGIDKIRKLKINYFQYQEDLESLRELDEAILNF